MVPRPYRGTAPPGSTQAQAVAFAVSRLAGSRLVLAPRALADLERLADFLLARSAAQARETGPLIVDALKTLVRHPLIGRPVEAGLRELLISRGRSGYKLLFAAPEMVRDLLRGLVALAWLKSAGLASLVRANDCEISVDLRMRRDSTRWIV